MTRYVRSITERPILFTPENAQKVHEGTKTQTRRMVKERPPYLYVEDGKVLRMDEYGEYHLHNPYGIVGDQLWVREAWSGADDQAFQRTLLFKGRGDHASRWRPSIHMPKWACRTWLEITAVRVERVQEISEADAEAEGCRGEWVMPGKYSFNGHRAGRVLEFRNLWESINGAGSWDANPFVWVLTFKKVNHE